MAKARITYRWADQTSVTCEVEASAEHPDALDQIVARVFDLYAKVSEFSNGDDDDA